MSFSQPAAGGDNFTPADHNGHLLIIYPKTYNPSESTTKGVTQAADADVIVVDKLGPDGAPLVFRDARLFGNLAKSTRNDIGGKVLGRLGQGPNTKGTPPWILQNFTDQDVAAASPVAAAFEAGQFGQPQPPNPMASATPAAAPAQQWQGAPSGGPVVPLPAQPASAPPQQQWNAPAAAPAQQWTQHPAAPPQAPQQWAPPPAAAPAPAGPPAAPAPAQAPAGAPPYDPALVEFLKSKGLVPPPDEATARAVAATFQ